ELALALEKAAVRWAQSPWLDPGSAGNSVFATAKVGDDFGVAEFAEKAVGVGVVADFMAFRDGAAEDLRIEVHAAADDIEGGLDVAGAEHVQQTRGVGWLRSII